MFHTVAIDESNICGTINFVQYIHIYTYIMYIYIYIYMYIYICNCAVCLWADNWFYAASGLPKVDVSNNPIESFQKIMKHVILKQRPYHLGELVNSILPKFIFRQGAHATGHSLRLGNIPVEPIASTRVGDK